MTITAVTGPGRVVQFMWGANQQNTLTFAWPAALDAPVFWREPQGGSELEQVNDGQDAWVTARDWRASFKARWLLPVLWSDVQRFIDWAAAGNAFALVPDAVAAPLFALPGCILMSPFDDVDGAVAVEDNGLQALDLSIRNPTYDLGLAWR